MAETAPQAYEVEAYEPLRVCRGLQLLRDWSHDESQNIPEVFRRGT